MRNLPRPLFLALSICLALAVSAVAQQPQAPLPTPSVKVGDMAPDFTLKDQSGKEISLQQLRGKNVALAFYVFAFSPT